MSLRKKLNRLKPHLKTDQEGNRKENVLEEEARSDQSVSVPFVKEWENESVTPYYFDGEYCLVREKAYPLNTKYGLYRFSEFVDAVKAWNQSSYNHPLSSKGFSEEELFFFDTETTGLGGGTGNTIFLLGQASIKGDHVVIKQHLLPKPGAEVALYQSFLESVNYTTLVTYNGKAFDWPQVKTRHTLIRNQVPKLPSFGHFDLFHAARRLWKHKLERLKLSIVEKEVLEIERRDDVPGFLAPMIYFDFVERQNPEGIIGILRHNEMDILSLITLYTHLTYQLLSIDREQSITESYEVGRWYAAIGETSAATEMFTSIAGSEEIDAVKAKLALSFQWKKEKWWEKARTLWEEIVETNYADLGFEASIELAKFYEHKVKDLQKALFYSEKAKDLLEVESLENTKNKKFVQVMKRLERLRGKTAKKHS
ncbi:ribonuclease H-like domain-containing protein [Bacillus dakarensis]|uniref:ribonuclease H-like domain-containing protein n=1 Tax=Robertmurraya dakarensis TaxID=1926278 RepID=UPI000980EC8B|nr:ribonuclease H-like domain-containing protein [Bacillus dakarensis]